MMLKRTDRDFRAIPLLVLALIALSTTLEVACSSAPEDEALQEDDAVGRSPYGPYGYSPYTYQFYRGSRP